MMEKVFVCERWMKGWRRRKKEVIVQEGWNEVFRLTHGGSSFDRLRTNG